MAGPFRPAHNRGTTLHSSQVVMALQCGQEVVLSGGAPTPAGTSVFTKHNWDMGMGCLWLNQWGIYGLLGWAFFHLMGGAFMTEWVGNYGLMGAALMG